MFASIASSVERRPHRVAAGRIADARGEVADQQRDVVPRVDELLQLAQHHRVADVQVGARRIEPELDAQRLPAREARRQLVGGFDVLAAVGERLRRAWAALRWSSSRSSNIVTPDPPSSALP